jgi:hypothetical protein
MRTTAPREGQDHDTLLPVAAAFVGALVIGALGAALPSQRAAAQASPPCTSIENDAERLACYDRALRAASPAPAAQTPAAPPAQAPAAQTAPTAAPNAPSATPAAAEPSNRRRIRESAAPAAPAAPAAGASAEDDDERIIPIVIIGMNGHPGREMYFTAQDGTRWVQTDSQRVVGLPDPPFEAELKPGTLGSQFLVPKDRGRPIRVRAAER